MLVAPCLQLGSGTLHTQLKGCCKDYSCLASMHRLAPGALQKPITVTFILTGKENAGVANVACILRIMSGLGHGIRMEKKVSLASQSVTDLVSHNRRQIEASSRFFPP